MKKLSTYFSLIVLLCSFITTPLVAYSETLDEPNTVQTTVQDNQNNVQVQNPITTEQSESTPVAPQASDATPSIAQDEVTHTQESQSTTGQESPGVVATDLEVSGSYPIQITDADKQQPAYFGGSIITLYNGISVSGTTVALEEGAYTVISLPKASFDKPLASGISTSFATFKDLEIRETETDWQIITTYKTLVGGYSADTPFKISLIAGKVINGSSHDIKQEFYSADDQLLAKSNYTVAGKAVIESPYPVNYGVERITKQIDSDYVIKDGETFAFNSSNLGYPFSNQSDPRDRRVIATIPTGTKIKEGTGWTKVPGTDNQYFKDLAWNQFNQSNVSVELDLSGIDLSTNDGTNNSKAIRVNLSVQPVVDGVVQTDIPVSNWYVQRNFYILKEEPVVSVYSGMQTSNSFTFLDNTYDRSKAGSTLYVPYNASDLSEKGRQTQQVVNYHWINNKKNIKDPVKFVIKTSQMTVSNYINPTQIKIDVVGLSSENSANLMNKLKGTKVYGIKSDGSKTLISDDITAENVPNISNSFTKDGWTTFSGADYRSILFEYPGDGLEFDKTEYDAGLYKSFWTSLVGDVKSTISDDLKKELPNAPRINQTDYASVTAETYVHSNETDDTVIKLNNFHNSSAYEVYLLQYDSIQNYSNTAITNGNAFYTDDTVTVRVAYSQTRNGNALSGVTPKNLNVYYLVPDGLGPLDNSNVFESIKIVPAYAPGYNLVIAKPKTTDVPNNLDIITQTTLNYYSIDFKVNSRLPIGSYVIRSAIAIDNNKFNSDFGTSSGIIQFNTPSGLWANITKNADNRSDNPMRFTDLNAATLNIYPNKVLVAYKSVKLASEPDTNYASSLGTKGKIGSEINYQLKLVNNSTRDIESISLIDKLPHKGDKSIAPNAKGEYVSRGSLFTTPLTGPVTSDIFDIYYTTDVPKETITDTKAMNWVDSVADYSKVTAIKAVLKPGQVIKVEATATITLNSKIEDSLSIADGEKAFNSYAYSLNDEKTFIEALSAEIPVNYDKKDIVLNKIDKFNPEKKLAHAIFDLYEKDGDKKIVENIETNAEGQAVLKNLIIGKAYYLKEVSAPDGYNQLESPIHFTVTEDLNHLDVENVKDEAITISGRKIWQDADNQDGKRPEEVTINLLANGAQVATKEVSVKTDWQYDFANVPKYKDGKEIVYTVTENTVTDYSTSVNGYDITNTYTPGVTSVTVTKNWVDDQNRDQIRPDSIQVQLFADGKKQGEAVTLNDANQWSVTWQSLPEKNNGRTIVYTIVEDKVAGYTTSVDNKDKGNILLTNTHEVGMTTIKGTKTWDDANNQAGKRPTSITVNLLANGQKVANQKVTADANSQWHFEFKEMPKFENGKMIDYTVTEEAVEGYQSVITGYDIVNRYTAKSTDPSLPDTGESKNTILTAAGIIMLAILGSYLYLKKRQVD